MLNLHIWSPAPSIFMFLQILWRSPSPIFYNTYSFFYVFAKFWFILFFRTLLPKTLTFGIFHKIPIGYFFGHSHTKRSFLKIHHNRLIYSSFFNFFVVFGAPVEAPLHRCAYFNSRLRKSASLEDTFFTKWCSRLSAMLIFTNDSFQNIGFGLVCVTPTAQNGGFMLFSKMLQDVL